MQGPGNFSVLFVSSSESHVHHFLTRQKYELEFPEVQQRHLH